MRQRQPRLHDDKHLALVRTMPCCCGCGRPAPSDAAHIRGNWGCAEKRETGAGEKPDDCWTVPLNPWCHTNGPDAQHRGSEQSFWERVGKNPFEIAKRLWKLSGGDIRAPKVAKPRKIKPRKAAAFRKKVPQGRALQSRGFSQ